MNILGISAFYHDSAAAIIRDGQIVAAAQEERFTRKKHDHQFPTNSVNYCVEAAGVDPVNFKDFSMLAQEWYLAGANLSGDISGDEFVDMEDLYILAKYWLSNCPPYPEESGGAALRSDINGDQVVNVQDLVMLADCWLSGDTTAALTNYHQGKLRKRGNLRKLLFQAWQSVNRCSDVSP